MQQMMHDWFRAPQLVLRPFCRRSAIGVRPIHYSGYLCHSWFAPMPPYIHSVGQQWRKPIQFNSFEWRDGRLNLQTFFLSNISSGVMTFVCGSFTVIIIFSSVILYACSMHDVWMETRIKEFRKNEQDPKWTRRNGRRSYLIIDMIV